MKPQNRLSMRKPAKHVDVDDISHFVTKLVTILYCHPQQSSKCNLRKRLIVVGNFPNFWKIAMLESSERCLGTFQLHAYKLQILRLQHKTFQLLVCSNYVYVIKTQNQKNEFIEVSFLCKNWNENHE